MTTPKCPPSQALIGRCRLNQGLEEMEMHLRGVLAQTGPTGILEALLSYNMASVCPDLLTLTKERHRKKEGRKEEEDRSGGICL
jgi:hypothetical protein